ncbi:MAG: hypothetical protein ACXABD_20850 [Candidatus Thorarchaeota archaeon]
MKEARVSAEQFVGAFVTLAEDDFAGAMERMARTIRGVQQNISDTWTGHGADCCDSC